MKFTPRFDNNADTIEDAAKYFLNRSIQFLKEDLLLVDIDYLYLGDTTGIDYRGLVAYYRHGRNMYQSMYLLNSFRGRGEYVKLYDTTDKYPIITTTDCDLEVFLKHKNIPYVLWKSRDERNHAYRAISNYYGDRCANRSGVHYMNHIDEGLAVLRWIGADIDAHSAYCLHPIYQSDEDFVNNVANHVYLYYGTGGIPSLSVLLKTIEYRSVANEYLSPKDMTWENIRLSPCKDVNDMLIADKVQNRKDFELYHKGTHENSDRLDLYFKNWLKRLNVTEQQYQIFRDNLNRPYRICKEKGFI